jgi:AraC-like DNA-binding protein
MHAPVYSEILATDAEAAHRLLTAAYGAGRMRFEPSGDLIFGRQRQDLGEVRLDEVHYSFLSEYHMDPLGYVLILRARDGEIELETERGPRRSFGAGDVFLCSQPDEGYHAITRTQSAQAVGVDLSLFEQVTDEPADQVVRRFDRGALAPEQARQWRRTVDYVSEMVANPEASASPLVLGAAGRMLAASTIAAFTARRGTDEGREETLCATGATARRAIAFLEANPDLDLGVVEIAQACNVSVRTLQVAFRRHLETTPMTYLRRVRLDRIHADLRAAEQGDGQTVAQVAARWGFADLGRLAGHYRERFGESPSVTLRA